MGRSSRSRSPFVAIMWWLGFVVTTSMSFVVHVRPPPLIRHCSRLTLDSSSSSGGGGDHQEPLDYIHLDHIDRVLCISDLHTDHAGNMQWLANHTCPTTMKLPEYEHAIVVGDSDLIVVAGDISHDMDRIEESLMFLLRTGASVLFVAGNHEAWLHSKELEKDPARSSMDKMDEVYQTCRDLGVYTRTCLKVGGTPERPHPLWLVPLDSWYDGSLSLLDCEDLCQDFGKWPWVDFIRCRWPYESMKAPNQKIPDGLAQHYVDRNQPLLQRLPEWIAKDQQQADTGGEESSPATVMTISHFLPNQQCLPDWKDPESPVFRRDRWLDHGGGGVSAKFAKVAGTNLLDQQIRALSYQTNTATRRIHVFGHSHRPKDFEWKGIRYVHHPLGKPREREIHMVSPEVDFQEIWKTKEQGEVPGEKVIRYWEEKGGGLEALLVRLNNSKRKSRYGKYLKKQMGSSTKK